MKTTTRFYLRWSLKLSMMRVRNKHRVLKSKKTRTSCKWRILQTKKEKRAQWWRPWCSKSSPITSIAKSWSTRGNNSIIPNLKTSRKTRKVKTDNGKETITTSNTKITRDSGKRTWITINTKPIKMTESRCKSQRRPKSFTLGNSKTTGNSIWMAWMETARITTRQMPITTGSSMAIRNPTRGSIITIITAAAINTISRTTWDNGTTTSNNNPITTINSRTIWINHHLRQIQTITSLSHFTPPLRECMKIIRKCKMWRRFTLSQTLMPIAFIHDKFIMGSSRMTTLTRWIKSLVLMDKWPMESMFQRWAVSKTTMAPLLVAPSNQTVSILTTTRKVKSTLKHRFKWIQKMLLSGDPIVTPSTIRHIRQMPNRGSHLLNEMESLIKIEYYSAEKQRVYLPENHDFCLLRK